MVVLLHASPSRMLSFTGHSLVLPKRGPAKPAARHVAHVTAVAELRRVAEATAVPSTVPTATSTPTSPSQLAELLMEREEELRVMLEPGNGLPPKASVVSALRKEIARLREQLRQEILAAAPGTKLDLPSYPTATGVSTDEDWVRWAANGAPTTPRSIVNAAGRSAGGSSAVSPGAASRVRNALRVVEERLAEEGSAELVAAVATGDTISIAGAEVGSAAWAQPASGTVAAQRRVGGAVVASSPEQLALEVLQIENARLRSRLEFLMNRETQLKTVAQRYLKAAERGATQQEAAAHAVAEGP